METLVELITTAAAQHGERQALTLAGADSSETWTYNSLYSHARRTAQLLQSRGISKGERIVLWAPNSPQWVSAFFASLMVGAAVVPLDVKSTIAFVSKVVAQTTPLLVIASASAGAELDTLGLPWLAIEGIDDLLPADDSSWQPAQCSPDDIAEIVFTSGTTGAPKGVLLSHGNILVDLQCVGQYIPSRQGYRMLSLLPLSHMLEQIAELFFALSAGASITYVDSLQPSTIFKAMRENKITAIPLVPQILSLFMGGIEREVRKTGKWRQWQLAHRIAPLLPLNTRRLLFRNVHERLGGRLAFVVSGGAYLDPHLAQQWENLGIKVVIGYGMTEAAPIVTANSLAHRNLRSVGRPVACIELKFAPDDEILVRGPNITRGYWQNEQATKEAFEDGWYKTGDLGYMDKDGYLYLKGRKKNMIVLSNGMNVYPEDIEFALLEEAGVTDAVVVGHELGGDVELHAVLLLQPDADAPTIVKRTNKRLAGHQRLKNHTVWPEKDFPRTHTLKPKRDEIAKIVGSPIKASETAPGLNENSSLLR